MFVHLWSIQNISKTCDINPSVGLEVVSRTNLGWQTAVLYTLTQMIHTWFIAFILFNFLFLYWIWMYQWMWRTFTFFRLHPSGLNISFVLVYLNRHIYSKSFIHRGAIMKYIKSRNQKMWNWHIKDSNKSYFDGFYSIIWFWTTYADFKGLKMCENQNILTRSKHRSYHKYGIGIYIEFHHRL